MRKIRFFGKSLERFGEKVKKILDLGQKDGLEAFTIRGNKLFLLISKWEEFKGLIVHYDLIKDTITLYKEIPQYIYFSYIWYPSISDNFDFCDFNGYFYKYDKTTNDYIIKSAGTSSITSYMFEGNKIYILSYENFNILDSNGNLIASFPTGGEHFSYDKTTNKAYVYTSYVTEFYEIDLNTYEYRIIEIPRINEEMRTMAFGISLRRIPNTNYILFVCPNTKKIWKMNLDTLELDQVYDLSNFYGISYAYISEDCKRIYLASSTHPWISMHETYVYDVEKRELEFILSTYWPRYMFENTKTNKLIIIDVPYFFYTFIIDLKTKRVETCIANNGACLNFTDGNLTFTL